MTTFLPAFVIDNASDPGVMAKQIWIDVAEESSVLCMTFTDNGSGMTPNKLHKMLRWRISRHKYAFMFISHAQHKCATQRDSKTFKSLNFLKNFWYFQFQYLSIITTYCSAMKNVFYFQHRSSSLLTISHCHPFFQLWFHRKGFG